jgi:hypothetical protein
MNIDKEIARKIWTDARSKFDKIPYRVDTDFEVYWMEQQELVKNCSIPDVRCSFYEFAKQYITIKDAEGNEQKFSDRQLNEIKEMEAMMNKGYELKFVHLRKGTQLRWVKK